MDYTGVRCPVCNNEFNEKDDIVVCPECGTPHHRACYLTLGKCANSEKHSSGFEFIVPQRLTEEETYILRRPEKTGAPKSPADEFEPDEDENENIPIMPPFGSNFALEMGENAEVDGIPLEEVLQYVGRDSFSSKLVFNLVLTDKFKRLRPNVAAFLLPYIWLFYRKMYKLGVLFIALTLVASAAFTNKNTVEYTKKVYSAYMAALRNEISIEELNSKLTAIQSEGTGNSIYYDAAPQIISFALRLVVALFANKWYLQKMKKQVLKTREECSSMDEYMAALSVKGGKSVPAAIISAVAFGALSVGYEIFLTLL